MADVNFNDFSIEVQSKMNIRISAALLECAGELESRVKRNSRVDTGKTKNSFTHVLDHGEHTVYIGSNVNNAIWEEFGTGEYALGNKGRKGGWSYKDAKGDWHFTKGKPPSRAFRRAYTSLRRKIIEHIENSLKGLES